MRIILLLLSFFVLNVVNAANKDYVPEPYTWTSQSQNSAGSMPCGGHDIGLNIWVENGDLLMYVSRSGFFDEHNTLLKAGRLRLHIDDNPFAGNDFRQTLSLDEGCVYVSGGGVKVRIWADVHYPVVFATIVSKNAKGATLSFESWRYQDLVRPIEAGQQDSWKWLKNIKMITLRDNISTTPYSLTFYHQNPTETVFDFTVSYEHLDDVKDKLYNPIGGLKFGGTLSTGAFCFSGVTDGTYASTPFRAWNYRCDKLKSTTVTLNLDINTSLDKKLTSKVSSARSAKWWHQYWQRSWIKSETPEAQHVLRNYELFRYMLGCNAYGEWPTKFNGGLFTFDPEYANASKPFTPDFRAWGGGTMTAQNQRLVYWPMLKSGDIDMMAAQFDTYLRLLPSAVARTQAYWGHDGASFTEQLENFGLPNPAEYGKHKEGDDYRIMKNKWLEHLFDTSLEFCQMILLANEYNGLDIEKYKPLIRECLIFFDLHYQQLAKQRGAVALDENGKLVIFPGSGVETHKMTYNACSTVAALKCVLETIDKKHGGLAAWDIDTAYLSRVPDIPTTIVQNADGSYEKRIAPAVTWMRIQNVETTQLYPLFPWRQYGIGMPDFDVARNTYYNDPWALKMRESKGWKQDNIWAALIGDVKGAKQLCMEKFADGPYRFPAFWDPGFDWAPDHNRGGSAMIGLQEMLLQEKDNFNVNGKYSAADNSDLILFPCWPKEWQCSFRLHATHGRVIEASN